MGRKWLVWRKVYEGQNSLQRLSNDHRDVRAWEGTAKCLPGKWSTHKRKFEKQSYKFLTGIKWQTGNEEIKCAHFLGWSHY